MDEWVIICIGNGKNDGRYVAYPGMASSYTDRLEDARLYGTREAAQRDACGNERVAMVRDCLRKAGA